jgi:PEP-CTERM motif
MKMNFILALALSAAVATPAFAGTTIFSGNTVGGPTYNRPIGGTPPTNLSGVGTAVRYAVNPFTVSVSGAYSFFNSTNYDSYLGIHANLFNPLNGLQNAIAYNDDFNGTLDGGFSGLNLLAGTSYFAISSGFDNNDFGAFTLTVTGPGDITGGNVLGAVPEPGIWGLMIVGFGLIGAALRRQTGRLAFAG